MSKKSNFHLINPSKILLTVVFISIATMTAAFAQNNRQISLITKLDATFRDYDLINIDPKTAAAAVREGKSLKINAEDEVYEINLRPRNLLAPNYRAEETAANGALVALAAPRLQTFRGNVVGDHASKVRLTISDNKIEGIIWTDNRKFYLEPASHFAADVADSRDFVLYEPQNLLNRSEIKCDLDDKLADAADKYLPAPVAPSFSTMIVRVAEIATEADFEFVNTMGGAAAANAEILDILNMIEGVNEVSNGITFSVTYQHAWTSPDPYPQSNTQAVLFAFKDYWNANFPAASYPRDTAHLFSDKATVRGQGLAVLNAVCRPDIAYAMHGRLAVDLLRLTLPAHEIAHNFNAQHAETGASCGNTVMNATLSNLTPLDFCQMSRSQIAGFVAGQQGSSCLTPRILARAKFDFDGDDRADYGVFRPTSGYWFVLNSGLNNLRAVLFGTNGDRTVAEDYDGDRRADIAVYRAGAWYILQSQTQTLRAVNFGGASDVPVAADFTGDGRAEVAVFRPSTGIWYTLDLTNNNFGGAQFGANGDVPTAADYDGDGKADISIYRPSNGIWARVSSQSAQSSVLYFGAVGDVPAPGDYDGDGKTDVAVFRPATPSGSTFFALKSSDGNIKGTVFGDALDIPVPADYDGDGRTDVAVFRSSNGGWYRLNSSNDQFVGMNFGANGDVPIEAR
jgi:hypothetical protein